MSAMNDPIDAQLASLARSTLAAAPPPPALCVIRILAERRRAELASRHLLALVTIASAAPTLIVLGAWALRPAAADGSPIAATLLALALAPAIRAIAGMAGLRAPAGG